MIQKAFVDDVFSAAQMKLWHKCFKDDQESVESDPCSGNPAARIPENVECVTGCIRQRSVTGSARARCSSGIPKTNVSEIFRQDFGMKRVMAKFVPWRLLTQHKEHHVIVANDLIQATTNEPDLLKKVITRDEL